MMIPKTLLIALVSFVTCGAGVARMEAQVAPTALRSPVSVTVGGAVSLFKTDYYTDNKLGGVGAYVDVNLFHSLGVEAEGRWGRFNEYAKISQDNYLIGPRYRFRHIWRVQPYAKALGGFSEMTFENGIANGRFTTFAFGGGMDLKLSRKWSVRAFDAEYQYWPNFLNTSLKPYGGTVGIGYKLF